MTSADVSRVLVFLNRYTNFSSFTLIIRISKALVIPFVCALNGKFIKVL